MQMIDVLKRLAELDAKNPNVVKEGQLGTMGLDAFPDELARMRATRAKMDNDAEWLLKNKPTDPCPKCGEPTTYRSSFGTTQKLICAKCGEVRLSSDDRKEHQDMAESASQHELEVSAYTMTLDQFLSEYGNTQEMINLWHKVNGKQGVAEGAGPQVGDEVYYGNRLVGTFKGYSKLGKIITEPNVDEMGDEYLNKDAYWDPQDKITIKPKQGVAEGLQECGMMGGMSQPHSPATINITADNGEELTGMLKDIMQLAGIHHDDSAISADPSVGVSADLIEPNDMGSMISKIDSLNAGPDDEEKVDEYDNTPNPTTAGLDAAVPSGNDLHKEKQQFPAAQRGDNPMAVTYESLMAEYREFVAEDSALADPNEADAPEEFELFADPYHRDYWGRGEAKIDPADQVMIVANELRKDPNEVAQTIVKFARDNPNHGDLTDSQVENAVKGLVPMLGKFSPQRENPDRGGIGQDGGLEEADQDILRLAGIR